MPLNEERRKRRQRSLEDLRLKNARPLQGKDHQKAIWAEFAAGRLLESGTEEEVVENTRKGKPGPGTFRGSPIVRRRKKRRRNNERDLSTWDLWGGGWKVKKSAGKNKSGLGDSVRKSKNADRSRGKNPARGEESRSKKIW